MIRMTLLLVVVTVACLPAFAVEDKAGQDNFVSNALSDAFTKVNQYMSGQKEIITDSEDAIGMKEDMGYGSDSLGMRVPKRDPRAARQVAERDQLY